MAEMTCASFTELAPELALGLLDGRERATALAHAASCDACQHELTALGALADELVTLTPAVEPPPGFETRVIAALQVPHRHSSRSRRVLAVAAAAAVAVGLSLGGWALSDNLGGSASHAVAAPPSAPLLTPGGHEVGEAMLTGPGSSWLSMIVSAGPDQATVTCRLVLSDGDLVTVGSFQLAGGEGYWAAAVPGGSTKVVGVQLVGANGKTIATANLRA
ncbi:MAG: hypothetical protein J2P57_24530 [Acidimicrobiaceae bacterium]|nr:hypothetical protein [Acidimicrobiaceae bacterium]